MQCCVIGHYIMSTLYHLCTQMILYTDDEEDDFIVDEQGRPLRRRKGDGTYSEP